jgi:hypothetical protein
LIVVLIEICRFYELLWKVSQFALISEMKKNHNDYAVPQVPLDILTNYQRVLDLSKAAKVSFVLFLSISTILFIIAQMIIFQLHVRKQSKKLTSHARRVVSAQEKWKEFDQTMYTEYANLQQQLVIITSFAECALAFLTLS